MEASTKHQRQQEARTELGLFLFAGSCKEKAKCADSLATGGLSLITHHTRLLKLGSRVEI